MLDEAVFGERPYSELGRYLSRLVMSTSDRLQRWELSLLSLDRPNHVICISFWRLLANAPSSAGGRFWTTAGTTLTQWFPGV